MLTPQFKEYLKSVSWNPVFFNESQEAHEAWLNQEDILTKKFYPNASGGFTLQQLQDAFMAGVGSKAEGGDGLASYKLEQLQPVISEMNGWANFRHWVLEGRIQDAKDFVDLNEEYKKAVLNITELRTKVAQLTDIVQNRIDEFSKQMITETIQQKMFFAEQAMTHLRKVVAGGEDARTKALAWLSQFKAPTE